MAALKPRVSYEEIYRVYQETRSVWRTGKIVGLSGQHVHERLKLAGVQMGFPQWTPEEDQEAADLSTAGVSLGEIARRLNRTYAAVAGRLSRMGVRNAAKRVTKIPRGAGYDKESIRKRIKDLDSYDGPVTRYARANGLNVELLIKAIQRDHPDWWLEYVRTHSDLPQKECAYCLQPFFPATKKQAFCDRKCAADSRQDKAYFGGQRRTTVGLAAGVCQVCARKTPRGLSAHHVLGKENDPDNLLLVALCQGCHQLVTLLGGKPRVTDPVFWESLISLAWMRYNGPSVAVDPNHDLYVEVMIEWQDPEDDPEDDDPAELPRGTLDVVGGTPPLRLVKDAA